ncbi:MAG: cyclic-di-AMP receptor [Anaerolineales bacterium]
MKMIIAILEDEDTRNILDALSAEGFTVTKIDSTGGFLRRGNSTLLIGADEEEVDQVFDIVHQSCKPAINPIISKATLLVLDIEHFERLS